MGQGDNRPADTRACEGHVTGFELVRRCNGSQHREECAVVQIIRIVTTGENDSDQVRGLLEVDK